MVPLGHDHNSSLSLAISLVRTHLFHPKGSGRKWSDQRLRRNSGVEPIGPCATPFSAPCRHPSKLLAVLNMRSTRYHSLAGWSFRAREASHSRGSWTAIWYLLFTSLTAFIHRRRECQAASGLMGSYSKWSARYEDRKTMLFIYMKICIAY